MRRILASWLVGAWIATSGVRAAHADEDPRRVEADALLKEGVALEEKKQEAEALLRFRKAFTLFPTANVLFAVASSEQALGKPLDALRHFRQAMKLSSLHPANAERGKVYVRELEGKLGRVVVRAPEGVTLSIDGTPYDGALDETVDLDPGAHTVSATLDGQTKQVPVTVVAGREDTVAVAFDPPSSSAVSTYPTAKPPPSKGLIVVAAGLGVGAIGAAALALVFHGNATGAVDDAKALPPTGDCRGQSTPTCARANDLRSDRDTADTLTTVSLIGAGALAVGAGTVATILFLRGRHHGTARITPTVAPGHAGASFQLSF